MAQSMPEVSAVTLSLWFSCEELVVINPGILKRKIVRRRFVLLEQFVAP